jgi:hypothetical protein
MQVIVAIGGAKQEAMFVFQSSLIGALAILHGGFCVACCNNACFLPVQDCLQCHMDFRSSNSFACSKHQVSSLSLPRWVPRYASSSGPQGIHYCDKIEVLTVLVSAGYTTDPKTTNFVPVQIKSFRNPWNPHSSTSHSPTEDNYHRHCCTVPSKKKFHQK